jgi:hypothetical protein
MIAAPLEGHMTRIAYVMGGALALTMAATVHADESSHMRTSNVGIYSNYYRGTLTYTFATGWSAAATSWYSLLPGLSSENYASAALNS